MIKWTDAIYLIIGVAGFIFGVIQYARGRKRKKDEEKAALEAEQEFKQEIVIYFA